MRQTFPEWLKENRETDGYSHRGLASEISKRGGNMSASNICRMESGERQPSETVLYQLAEIFEEEDYLVFHMAKRLPVAWQLKIVKDLEMMKKLASI